MTDEVEVLDVEPRLAAPRWRIDGDTLTLHSGEEWEIPEDIPEAVWDAIHDLPYDYIELGTAAADAQDRTRMALRLQEAAELAVDEAEGRLTQFETVSKSSKIENALATLTYDLEAACNLLIRISVALGIQPGGEFYNNIKNLVEKYGMTMKYAKGYTYSELTGGGAIEALDSGPATIVINEKGKVELKPQLTEGEDG